MLLERSLKGAAGCRAKAWVEDKVPFGKLQEAKHFLWGVDISQRVVRVHQYKPSDDKTLKDRGNFYFKHQQTSSIDKTKRGKWSVPAFVQQNMH